MFSYSKLFLISASLCSFLLLSPDRVFLNHLSNTSINPNFVSKYSFVKLKSGFVRPLAQAASRGTPGSSSLFRGTLQGRAGAFGGGTFQPGSQGSTGTRLRPSLGSSQAVARAISRTIGTSSGSASQFMGSSSGTGVSAASPDLRGSTSAGSSVFPRSPSTQNPQLRNWSLQSQHRASHSNTGVAPAPSRSGSNSPLVRPVGCLSVQCPKNRNSQHFIKPGRGQRQRCQYCD